MFIYKFNPDLCKFNLHALYLVQPIAQLRVLLYFQCRLCLCNDILLQIISILIQNVYLFQDEWLECQTNWLYLEAIFSAPDIQKQLPLESKMFLQVDKSWKEIMRRTAKVTDCGGFLIISENRLTLTKQLTP